MTTREQLIRAASRAAEKAYRSAQWGESAFVRVAEACLAVFEEAHAPTDDERPTIELARLIASWDQGVEATNRISHWAVNLAMHLRELGFRRTVPPTDDEREALATRWLSNYHGSIDATALVLAFKAGLAAGFRRAAQGERERAAAAVEGGETR